MLVSKTYSQKPFDSKISLGFDLGLNPENSPGLKIIFGHFCFQKDADIEIA